MRFKRTLLAGLAAAALIAALALYSTADPAHGGTDFDVTVQSATILPNGEATVEVYADDVPAPGPGAWSIDVYYDASLVGPSKCVSNISYCAPFPGNDFVRVAGATASGVSGRVVFATITFAAGSAQGMSDLEIVINQMATPTSQEIDAGTINGSITVSGSAPTPSPAAKLQGDTDCDGDVDSADALGVLRDSAGFPDPKCAAAGDVDCDGDRDPADALAILRYAADLPPSPQSEPCPDIGTPV